MNQRGAVIIYVALCMVGLLGMAALAVDLGYMYVTRNELQNISDSASLAATRYLGHIYEGIPPEQQEDHSFTDGEITAIKSVAMEMGMANAAAGKNIIINSDDIVIGRWDWDSRNLEDIYPATQTMLTAVRVTARRDGAANLPVTTFFANVLGIGSVNVNTLAVASLSGQRTAAEGSLPIPVGISKARFESAYCDREIHFYPTNDPLSCGGWHTYTGDIYQPNAGVHGLPTLLNDLKDGNYVSPATDTGTIFTFTGGTLASVFDEMKALFDANKIPDATSPSGYSWTASVAVYDSSDCSNPNPGDTLKVVGFAEITITQVLESPSKVIDGVIKCNYVKPSRGGGGDFGTLGSIPNLVQ